MLIKFRKISAMIQALTLVFSFTVSCKGRSGQTIEVSPTPPSAPSPGAPPISQNSKDPFGTYKKDNPDSSDPFGGSPSSSSPSGAGNANANTNTGSGIASPTSPSPSPSPTPAPAPPTSNLSNCDRYNTEHFGGGYGPPFLSNGVWLGYQDSQRTVACLLAIPKCSTAGYGTKFCKGPLTLAKDSADFSDSSICVLDYTPSATCPGT
ncbi:MAG: hypothetical protein NTY08_03845 [Proteobacteria bacterium]|nr:hypothetical protein [Pseudomonadota bacterium]